MAKVCSMLGLLLKHSKQESDKSLTYIEIVRPL